MPGEQLSTSSSRFTVKVSHFETNTKQYSYLPGPYMPVDRSKNDNGDKGEKPDACNHRFFCLPFIRARLRKCLGEKFPDEQTRVIA